YREMNRRANMLANYVRRLGVAVESRAGIAMERSVEMCIAALAVMKAGGAYVPIDPSYPEPRITAMLKGITLLLTDSGIASRFEGMSAATICMDFHADQIGLESAEDLLRDSMQESLVYLIHTSGSTGVPKAVAINHIVSENLLHWHQSVFPPVRRT